MAKRWTPEEIEAWDNFLRNGGSVPEGRTVEAAVRKLDPRPRFADMTTRQFHVMSSAIFPFLRDVPYRGDGKHIEFIERAERIAVEPWHAKADTLDGVLLKAAQAAREALRAHG